MYPERSHDRPRPKAACPTHDRCHTRSLSLEGRWPPGHYASSLLLAQESVGRTEALQCQAVTKKILHQSFYVLRGGNSGVAKH